MFRRGNLARLSRVMLAMGLCAGGLLVNGGELSVPEQSKLAQMSASDVEARIRRIENGLLPDNVIKGQPLPRMKLVDSMKEYGTPGVSIALINNYRIEWARGYGVRAQGTSEQVTP